MKLLLLPLLILAACSGNAADTPPTETTTLAFSVEGMHCQACVDAITASVEQVHGVTQCTVSLEDKQAVVLVDDPALKNTILEIIQDLKFKVESMNK